MGEKGKWIAVVLAGVGVLGCEPLDRLVRGAADGLRSPRGVRVIALTDFHGALEPRRLTAKFEDGTEETLISGGAAYLAAYVEKLRGESPFPAVVVDAGDLFQGTFLSNSEEGRPVTEFYNELGVDAAAVGNHEFDFGPVGPSTAPQSPGEDPVGALKAQMKRARFAFLSLNIREKATGKSPAWARPSVLLERGGVKVGIIGATTPSTPFTTLRTNVAHLDFLKDMEGLIRDEAAELRARGAEVVVLAIHEGGSCLENGKAHRDAAS